MVVEHREIGAGQGNGGKGTWILVLVLGVFSSVLTERRAGCRGCGTAMPCEESVTVGGRRRGKRGAKGDGAGPGPRPWVMEHGHGVLVIPADPLNHHPHPGGDQCFRLE